MKWFQILSHPYTLLFCFCFIIVSGENMGGFYIMYILLGLLHCVLHSLLGFYGLLALVISHLKLKRNIFLRQVLGVLGVSLMTASVFFFFRNDTTHYNWGTFEQVIPMFTLVFTTFCAICFLIRMFRLSQSQNNSQQNILSKV